MWPLGYSSVSVNIYDQLENKINALSSHSDLPEKVKNHVIRKFEELENAFQLVNSDLSKLPIEIQQDSNVKIMLGEGGSHPIIIAKRHVVNQMLKQQDIKSLMQLTSRIEKTLLEMHNELKVVFQQDESLEKNELKYIELSSQQCLELTKGVLSNLFHLGIKIKRSEQAGHLFKPAELRLGKLKNKALQWLQKSRVKLLKGEGSNQLDPHQIPALMKKIGDLEVRLQNGDKQALFDFKDLVLSSEVNLSEVYMTALEGEEKGASQSYLVYDVPDNVDAEDKQRVGVFKPSSGDAGIKPAVPDGFSHGRQTASFLIDQMSGGKAGVAFTMAARAKDDSVGALQIFKNSKGSLADFANERQFDWVPVDQLHLLSIHRLRLYDLDAHAGNALWNINQEGNVELISIDHDYCFPVFNDESALENINNYLKIGWQNFPQMDQPFSQETIEYIQSLDIDKEAEILAAFQLEIESINLFKTMTWFLQEATKNQFLLPGEIADFLLSQDRIERDKFPLVRHMIQLQREISMEYPFHFNEDEKQAYDAQFESRMKAFIQENVQDLESDIQRFGSWHRPTHTDSPDIISL